MCTSTEEKTRESSGPGPSLIEQGFKALHWSSLDMDCVLIRGIRCGFLQKSDQKGHIASWFPAGNQKTSGGPAIRVFGPAPLAPGVCRSVCDVRSRCLS